MTKQSVTNKGKADGTDKRPKCFVMMPFTDPTGYDKGHFEKVYSLIIKDGILAAGYEPFRVDEDKDSSWINTKIVNYAADTEMALCDLSGKNPNVLYELGIRHAFDKPTVLIKDDNTGKIFDVANINTVDYKGNFLYENVVKARSDIKEAILATSASDNKNSIINMASATKASFNAIENETNGDLKAFLDELSWKLNQIASRFDVVEHGVIVNTNTNIDDINRESTFSTTIVTFTPTEKNDIRSVVEKIQAFDIDRKQIIQMRIDGDTVTIITNADLFEENEFLDFIITLGDLNEMYRT